MGAIKERSSALSRSETAWLSRATNLAATSTVRQKHGAIIVRGGSILALGINSVRNESIRDLPDSVYTTHAESAAIRSLGPVRKDSLAGCTLYVARISRGGNIGYSRPCDDCYRQIGLSGIKTIIFTL